MLTFACMRHAKSVTAWGASTLLIVSAAACAANDSLFAAKQRGPDEENGLANGDTTGGAAPSAAGSDFGPTDNGVIVVHAAGATAFRLCFQNEFDLQPIPNAELMPDANVAGVDVGSAVRIGPLKGAPGDVYLFDERTIRPSYPPGGSGPSCGELVGATGGYPRVRLGKVDADLSRGVHLLVLRGCAPSNPIRSYTKAECGTDYDESEDSKGNLTITTIELMGRSRTDDGELPAEVVHLSQPLETFRGPRTFRVSFGELGKPPSAKLESPTLGASTSFRAPLRVADVNYERFGFTIGVDGDNDAVQEVASQSLADIQRLSAPRALSKPYYAGASNYAFLLLGTPPSVASPDAGDERTKLHLLAVPVITRSTADAGTDASASP